MISKVGIENSKNNIVYDGILTLLYMIVKSCYRISYRIYRRCFKIKYNLMTASIQNICLELRLVMHFPR